MIPLIGHDVGSATFVTIQSCSCLQSRCYALKKVQGIK